MKLGSASQAKFRYAYKLKVIPASIIKQISSCITKWQSICNLELNTKFKLKSKCNLHQSQLLLLYIELTMPHNPVIYCKLRLGKDVN